MTCPSGQVCVTSYSETMSGNTKSESLARTCSLSSQCNVTGSVTIQGGKIYRVASTCCDTDGCTPALPTLPKKNSTLNGLVCRTCVYPDSGCDTSDTLRCTGDEKKCIRQTTHVTGPGSAALRGCATQSVCDLTSQSQSFQDLGYEFICTSDGASVHNVVLAPALACLLLLKFFF